MTQRAFPFDGVVVNEEDYLLLQAAQRGAGKVFEAIPTFNDPNAWRVSGVVRGSTAANDGALKVTPAAGRTVDVAPGLGVAPGFLFENNAVVNLAVAANSSGSVRNDRVVVQFDFTANTATLAVTSAAAALDQTYPIWEVELARLAVPNGFTTLVVTDIIDARNFVGLDVPWGRAFAAGNGQSRYYPVNGAGTVADLTIAANTAYWMPFLAGRDTALAKVTVVSGAGAISGSLRAFLYAPQATGPNAPGDLLADLGTLALSVADTVYEVAPSPAARMMRPGLYWLAVASLTGATVGPIKAIVSSLTVGSVFAPPPAAHPGGTILTAGSIANLPMAAYSQGSLGGVMPNPASLASLIPTPSAPLVFLS